MIYNRAFIIDEDIETHLDSVTLSKDDFVLCWVFYETFDAHRYFYKPESEQIYDYDDLILCRSRLLYYLDEDHDNLIKLFEKYYNENSFIESYFSDIEYNCDPMNIGLSFGYILKFLDTLVEQHKKIKIIFN